MCNILSLNLYSSMSQKYGICSTVKMQSDRLSTIHNRYTSVTKNSICIFPHSSSVIHKQCQKHIQLITINSETYPAIMKFYNTGTLCIKC